MLVRETLRALMEPRRIVPLALVLVALLVTEWIGSGSLAALAIDAALFAAFVVISPALFRRLFVDADESWPTLFSRWTTNVTVAALVTASIGIFLPPLVGMPWTYVSEPRSFGVLVALFVVGGWGLGRDIELSLGVARASERAEKLAIETEHAQILALRAQLDPHFLFNTLNAIAEWCREDPVVAENAMLELSRLLRAIFEALQSPSWSLGRELAVIEQLGGLYAVRDAERYVVRLDVDERAKMLDVPPLVLLPLFENAIKHGPAAGHRGAVTVTVRRDDATTIEITNPGAFSRRREGGHGLAMVERRLALAYGDRARFAIGAEGDVTLATVRLPGEAADRP